MIIDTKEEATTLAKTKVFIMIIFITLTIVIAIFLPASRTVKILICGILAAAFLVFYWFQFKMQYTYIYFSNNGRNLVFRFYSLRNLYGKPKSIEIPKATFLKYDITTGFFNKKDTLILFQKTNRGVAKYPPISLTLLNKMQKTELKRALFAEMGNNANH